MAESYTIPVQKWTADLIVTAEQIEEERLSYFPRRSHGVKHDHSPEEKAAYAKFKREWRRMEKLRDRLYREGERTGWATGDHGYEWEPAELYKLEPRVEFVYDETEAEWEERVANIYAHYDKTGEWLEEPQSWHYAMAREIARKVDASVIAGLAMNESIEGRNE